MHDRSHLIEQRIERFVRERLVPALHVERADIELTAWEAPGEPVALDAALAADYRPFTVGETWGRAWGTTWFAVRGRVPEHWNERENARAELVVDLGFTSGQSGFQAEGLVWRRDGSIIKAVSPFNAAVPNVADDEGAVDVLVEAAANPDVGSLFTFEPTQLGDVATAGDDHVYRLRQLELGLRDLTVDALVADVTVLTQLVGELDGGLPRRAEILEGLDRMMDAVDPHDVAGTAADGRAVLAPLLASPAHASAHVLHAVGHAHIDSAWLWPVRETKRKVARTFSNVLALMDEDPGFVFAHSSAQQYAWIKESYPDIWSRLVERVREGRFVPVGSMWVESDTNMVGGEAMARQFLEGKRFFLDEFGIDTEEVWLPDSFGYTAALPQIMREAGARWFLTQKISWNETNQIPHHTFQWEGIDGSRIFTHFPPVDKYNSEVSGADLAHAQRNFNDKGRARVSLLPYGYGDGGGGPTREMTAAVARTTSLEGSAVARHSSPREFFETAEAEYARPEVWRGELYLEFHRGTYTSQLHTKQGNRRSEHLLREAELWAATAAVRTGAAYPAEELRELWQKVLLLQFHDILPGTSIAWVHRDAERNYEAIAAGAERLIAESLAALSGDGEATLFANAAPHARDGVGALAIGRATAAVRAVPAADGDAVVLENGVVRARIDADGSIGSLVDVATGRETVPPGQRANVLQLFRDTPTQWDAWDIDETYRRNVTDVPAEAVEIDGADVVVRRTTAASTFVQRIRLAEGSRTLDLAFDIDWHEEQKLLKLAFPVDVHTDQAASEVQFGHVVRPTHTNTSWEAARFETAAHRWVRVAERGFGVAVSNDSTYGHDITRHEREGGGTFSLVRLSLVRAPKFPDPTHDEGAYRLQVGVVVGADVQDAVVEGYRRNLSPRVVENADPAGVEPIVSLGRPGVVVEAVKLAHDGSGDVIVRVYESLGERAHAPLHVGFAHGDVVQTDLLERPVAGGAVLEGGAALSLRPFQLVTLRIARA